MGPEYVLPGVGIVAALVVLHEGGHFLAAKLCGIDVPIFSIGFGRRLIGIQIGGTDYRISAIPFGGYVGWGAGGTYGWLDAEEDEADDPAGGVVRKGRGFAHRPAWQRFFVLAAGPLANLVLPFAVFTLLYMAGKPQPASQIGSVDAGSPAMVAGVAPGDRVVAADGTPVATWLELEAQIATWSPGPHRLTVERGGIAQELSLTVPAGEASTGSWSLGLDFYRPSSEVGVDDPASSAGRAGIVSGERIVEINGEEVDDWVELEAALAQAAGPVEVEVEGKEGGRTLTLAPPDPARTLPVPMPQASVAQRWGLLPATLFVDAVSTSLAEDPGLLGGCTPPAAVEAPPSPAQKAGVLPGDRIASVDGRVVMTWSDVLDAVRDTMEGEGASATSRPIDVVLVRGGQPVTVQLLPEVIQDTDAMGRYFHRPVLGIVRLGANVEGEPTRVRYGLVEAFEMGSTEALGIMRLTVEQMGKLVSGGADVSRSVGGPVEMVRQAKAAAERGIFEAAQLAAMLSISLGLANLIIPIPILDGGQILFLLIEVVRGRPLAPATQERVLQIGVMMVAVLMLCVLALDLSKCAAA